MNYTSNSHVNSADEVRDFFHYLVYEKHINFHPDDPIEAYEDKEFDGDYSVTEGEAEIYNRLMDEAFECCGEKVYDIGCDVLFGYLDENRIRH